MAMVDTVVKTHVHGLERTLDNAFKEGLVRVIEDISFLQKLMREEPNRIRLSEKFAHLLEELRFVGVDI